MTHDEWLQERMRGIGGSDAASVIGKNPWKTNIQLWEEKTGKIKPQEISQQPHVRYGTQAEEFLRALFCLDYPQYTLVYEPDTLLRDREYPFLTASLDGILTEKKTKRKGILEIKTANIMTRQQMREWENRLPQQYYIQCLHYLMVTGYSYVILKAQKRISWKDPLQFLTSHYFILSDDVKDDIFYLREKEIEFWNINVKQNIKPALILPDI